MDEKLEIPIFELNDLKKAFWTCFIINTLIAGLAYASVNFLHFYLPFPFSGRNGFMFLFFVLLIASLLYNAHIKKILAQVLIIKEAAERHTAYSKLFKKRLTWNIVSITTDALLYVITIRVIFLYILLIQLVLLLLSFPNKKLIARELNNHDIVFN